MSRYIEKIIYLIEQATGSAGGGGGAGGNGGGNGGGTGGNGTSGNGSTNGNGGETGDPTPKNTNFHGHHLGGYGRYYCQCDDDTPLDRQCPNCKARRKR